MLSPSPRCPCCGQVLPGDTDLVLSADHRSILRAGKLVILTMTQWRIFEVLRSAPDGLEGEAIYTRVYGTYGYEVEDNTLKVHISMLRKRLALVRFEVRSFGWGSTRGANNPRATYQLVDCSL